MQKEFWQALLDVCMYVFMHFLSTCILTSVFGIYIIYYVLFTQAQLHVFLYYIVFIFSGVSAIILICICFVSSSLLLIPPLESGATQKDAFQSVFHVIYSDTLPVLPSPRGFCAFLPSLYKTVRQLPLSDSVSVLYC